MENINDTTPEEELEVQETTPEETPDETVDFSEALEQAETEEEVIALAKEAIPETSGVDETVLDTEPEPEVEEFDFKNGIAIKDGDIELNITDVDQARRLMQQGLNYAGKTTELAKYRSFVNYAEENGISLEDIQLMHDIKGGNKDAYSKLAKESGIDIYDVSEDQHSEYQPDPVQLQQQNEPDPRVDQIAGEILQNEDYTAQFQKWLPKMPQEIQDAVTSDSGTLSGVYADMQAGVFDGSMNQAYQYMRVDGMDFNSAYVRAKQEFTTINEPAKTTPPVTRGARQRAAAPRQGSGGQNTKGYAPGVISDMSDDDFMENYRDILNSVRN